MRKTAFGIQLRLHGFHTNPCSFEIFKTFMKYLLNMQPRSQSSSDVMSPVKLVGKVHRGHLAILDVTSPVKLVGKVR